MVSNIQLSAAVNVMRSLATRLKAILVKEALNADDSYALFTSVNVPFLQTIPSYHSRPNLPILNSFPLSPTGGYFTENR